MGTRTQYVVGPAQQCALQPRERDHCCTRVAFELILARRACEVLREGDLNAENKSRVQCQYVDAVGRRSHGYWRDGTPPCGSSSRPAKRLAREPSQTQVSHSVHYHSSVSTSRQVRNHDFLGLGCSKFVVEAVETMSTSQALAQFWLNTPAEKLTGIHHEQLREWRDEVNEKRRDTCAWCAGPH